MLFPKGITYTVARAASTVLRIAIAGLACYLTLHVAFIYLDVHLDIASGIAIAVVAILIWRGSEVLFRYVLHPQLRRVFFHDYYSYRKILSELRTALTGILDVEQILNIVSSKVQETFGARNVSLFLRDEATGNFVGSYSVGLQEDFSAAALSKQPVVSRNAFRTESLSREWYPIVVVSDDYRSGWQYVAPEESYDFSVSQNRFLQNMNYAIWVTWALFRHILGIEVPELRHAVRVEKLSFNEEEASLLRDVQAAALVVIRLPSRVLGFMTLGHRRAGMPFSAEDQELLRYISRSAAEAINSARGLDAFSEFLKIWQEVIESSNLDEVLDSSLRAVVDAITRAEAGSLYLWDPERQKLVLRAQKGFSPDIVDRIALNNGEGYAGWVFEKGIPVGIADVRSDDRTAELTIAQRCEFTSALCVPLKAHGFRLGVLCLDGKAGVQPFQSADLERVWALAQQIAFAIFNARLNEELYALGIAINKGGLTAEKILEAVTQSVFSLTNAHSANTFLLRDPHNPELSLEFDPLVTLTTRLNLKKPGSIRPRQRGMTYLAIQNREPCFVSKQSEWPGINESSRAAGVVASAGFPLIVDGLVNGVFFINYHTEHKFTDAEKRALALFADQAAFALNSARQRSELALTDNVAWMGLLFPSMSHKIIQRTGSIANDVKGLRMILEDRADVTEYLDGIDTSLDNLKRLRRETLSLPQEHQIVRVELHKTLRSQLPEWCKSDPGIDIDFSGLEVEECIVMVDHNRFNLVLEVLAINAVKAMKKRAQKLFRISSKTRKPWIIIEFTNTGEPIPKEVAKRLFVEHIQSNGGDGASGVGLLISRRIVRRYGGELELVRSDESGTTFSIWLTKTV